MIRRRAAPGPPPRAHAAAPPPAPPGRPAAPARPRRAARKRPTCGPGGPARGNAQPPENGPRWPENAAVAAARKHSAVCAARAPGRPPPPEAQLAPARAARRAPGSVRRRPRAAREAPPAPQPSWPCEGRPAGPARGGVPPGGIQSLGANGWRPRPPLTQKKPQSNGGLTPPGKDGEADGQGWYCPGWTACRLRAKE